MRNKQQCNAKRWRLHSIGLSSFRRIQLDKCERKKARNGLTMFQFHFDILWNYVFVFINYDKHSEMCMLDKKEATNCILGVFLPFRSFLWISHWERCNGCDCGDDDDDVAAAAAVPTRLWWEYAFSNLWHVFYHNLSNVWRNVFVTNESWEPGRWCFMLKRVIVKRAPWNVFVCSHQTCAANSYMYLWRMPSGRKSHRICACVSTEDEAVKFP